MSIRIYHNPRCSKSRQTLALLIDGGYEPQVIEYLKTPPDAADLETVITALGVQPLDVMRTGDDTCREAAADLNAMNRNEQIDWLAEHIHVLQRPIVVNGTRARIGRPPETVHEILP